MTETAYEHPRPFGARLDHGYGANVHVLSDTWSATLLARLCHPDTDVRAVHPLITACYRHLLGAASEQLRTCLMDLPTRMTEHEARARNVTVVVDPEEKAVVVDVARAGMIPAHVLQLGLMEGLRPNNVRVDHIYLQRVVDPQTGEITGVHHSGSKLGGDVAGRVVFVPDPMAATGSSMKYVIDVYRNLEGGAPRKIVACHLIVTPEYLRNIARTNPDVEVYTLRVDRGLSSPEVLASPLGARWDEEIGLDHNGYIVPGAGGVGELVNNAWI